MKTFVIALCIFGLLLLTVTANFLYINRVTQELSALLDRMDTPERAAASFAELEALWAHNRTMIGLSVPFLELCNMDEQLAQMRVALAEGEEIDFLLARALAGETVRHIGRLERFSWECIF